MKLHVRNIVTALVGLFVLVSCGKRDWGDRIVVCGDSDIYIVDTKCSTEDSLAVTWSWNVNEADIPQEIKSRCRSFDDCKPVDGGRKLLLTSSSGATLLMDIVSRKCEFYAITPMAHSADMLPGGMIAVANSVTPLGNSLELYSRERNEDCLWRDSLYFGHGVVWSEKMKSLYALGYDELRRYTPAGDSLVLEKTFAVPGTGCHELSPVGDDVLLCSTHNNVYLFDLESCEWTEFDQLASQKGIKSANYDPESGRLIYTRAETSWWTNHVYILERDGSLRTLTFSPDYHLYKVRVLD